MNKYSRIAVWSVAASMLSLGMAAQAPAAAGAARKVPSLNAPSATGAQQAAPATAAPAANANPFPPVNPKYFTATVPTVDTVNAFLHQLWGFDPDRIWSVQAILKTNAPGVAKVIALVSEKGQAAKAQQTVFYTTPDGNHAIAENVMAFGATPFAEVRKTLQDHADGAARGAAGKGLMLVEFTDLQCPHCKDAQPTMDQLVTDFPQARVVIENFPLAEIHPQAFNAAAVGVCVRKAKGDDAFFKYAQAVFDTQASLDAAGETATLSAAVTKAGGDPAAALACAKTQPTIDNVNASVQLGKDVGVDSTPMLYINGFVVPVNGVPYEVLKKIVAFRGNEDGTPVTVQPSLKQLK